MDTTTFLVEHLRDVPLEESTIELELCGQYTSCEAWEVVVIGEADLATGIRVGDWVASTKEDAGIVKALTTISEADIVRAADRAGRRLLLWDEERDRWRQVMP